MKKGKKIPTHIDDFFYGRKSEEDKSKQVLSISRQDKWADREAAAMGRTIAEECKFTEEKSAKVAYQRPVFDRMIDLIKQRTGKGKPARIFTWKMHRLARNPEEAGIIIGMLARGEIAHIVTGEREYRSDDNAIIPYVEFAFADQYSRDLSSSVTDGLHNKAELGWYPGLAPLGYRNTKDGQRGTNKILVDKKRFEPVRKAWQLMASGNVTVAQIMEMAHEEWNLTSRSTRTRPVPKPLVRSGWYHLFTNPFYYGWYEYPKGSEQWHKGKHKPMITTQEFDSVQVLLGRKGRPRPKKYQFAFRGMFRCGLCLTAVTAENKIKRQKNGNVHRYIYYHCTKSLNPKCPERSIEASDLVRQIAEVLGSVQISDEFKTWAIRYLHLVEEDEERKDKAIEDSNRTSLAKVKAQLENLLLKYAAPENSDGLLVSDQEYRTLKSRLQKQEGELQAKIGNHDKDAEQADDMTEQTFHFATYAEGHFMEGDNDTKRAVLSFASSNLLLQYQKALITLRKPLKVISEKRDQVEAEISRVRTSKNGGNKEHFAQILAKCPILCALVDDVRTYFLTIKDAPIIPILSPKRQDGKEITD